MMDLFPTSACHNWLRQDGEVYYHEAMLYEEEAWKIHDILKREIPWQNDRGVLFGKPYVTARKVAWYGDENFSYGYSGVLKQALPWHPLLADLKHRTELLLGETFNCCLLNLYHSGEEGMGWHSDDEPVLGPHPCIASLSLGANRVFRFKHRHLPQTASISLAHGSLLVMKGSTQKNWLHSLPKSKKILTDRINLTFRTICTR